MTLIPPVQSVKSTALKLREYRCTRNASNIRNLSDRQGYYLEAHSHEDAVNQMRDKFPREVLSGFTSQLWK